MSDSVSRELAPYAGQPEGWVRLLWDPEHRVGLCHPEGSWYQSPDNTLYCGTCHPTPWLTHVDNPFGGTMATTAPLSQEAKDWFAAAPPGWPSSTSGSS